MSKPLIIFWVISAVIAVLALCMGHWGVTTGIAIAFIIGRIIDGTTAAKGKL